MQVYLPYLAILTAVIIWGFSFIFTKDALNILTPFQLLGFRFAASAILLSSLKLLKIIKINFSEKPLKNLLVLAFFQPLLYFTCETIGIKLTSASETGIIIAIIPIFTAIMGVFLLKEYPSKLQLFFITLSVAGVIFIVLMQNNKEIGSHLAGIFILMGAVLSAAVYNISSRMNSVQFNPLEITFVMIWVGAIFFNIIGTIEAINQGVCFRDYISVLADFHAYTAVLYLSILSSVAAFFLYNYSLANIQASQAAIFANMITVISVAAGVIILKESFHWYQAVGGILIILGVWGTNYFAKQPIDDSKLSIQ